MKSKRIRGMTAARTFRGVGALAALLAGSGHLIAQTSQEVKVPRPLPHMGDIKSPSNSPTTKGDQAVREQRPTTQFGSPTTSATKSTSSNTPHRPTLDLSQVYFDAPGDGSVWAMGHTYKASFQAGRATYIPFLGSSAPQNYPLTFSLRSITAGNHSLPLNASAAAARSGTRVSFDRGSVVELYEMKPGSMEQDFVFTSLPAGGDLVVTIDVETGLTRSESAEGLRFTNALGAVHYSRAVVADAEGNRTPVATSFANNSIEIRVPAAFLATATFPVTIDPVTTTFGVSTLATDDDTQPDIAYEATSDVYQVCWERAFSSLDHDVYSQLQNASGITIPGSTVTIDFTSDYWARPRTASNAVAAQFLVAAEVGAPGGGTRIIKGRTRDACSTTTGSQFQISDPVITSDQFDVDVGGDPTLAPPTYYCVTWERIFSSTDHDIFARLVLSNSTLLGTSTISVDNTSGTLDEHPAVSKSDGSAPFTTQEWSIVWQRQFSPTDHDIRGAQIHWDGTITNASFSIDFSGSDDTLPTVSSEVDGASGTRNYLAAWQRQFSPDKDIEGAALNGAALLGEADISVLEGAFSSQDQILPSADSDGSGFAVAYSELYQTSTTDYDVYIAALSVSGGIISLVEGHQNLAFTSNPEVQAQVTSRHSGGGETSCYAAVWDQNTGGQGDVLGGIYGTPGSGPASITSYCFPGSGGVIACPCANPGGAGSGCDNSIATGGGLLTATGVASLSGDTLVFTQSGELSSSLSIILQGDTNLCFGTLFGDGVRCVGGNLKRLYVHSAAGGVVSGPVGVDPSVSARSAALGDTIAACTTRAYQVYYRDPNLGFCPAGFNVGNALRVLWGM